MGVTCGGTQSHCPTSGGVGVGGSATRIAQRAQRHEIWWPRINSDIEGCVHLCVEYLKVQ